MVETSKLFTVETIADGVHVVLAKDDGPALGNAGIVDLGDRTLVFDTLGTAVGGEALREAAQQLTGRSPSYVVNSHAHYDHWCGNQAFVGTSVIIAATRALQSVRSLVPSLRQTIDDPEPLAARLRECRERLADDPEPRWRATLERAIPRLQQQLAALLTLKPTLPALSFQSELVFHGAQRTAVLRNHGAAHSQSDSYLVLPDEGIVFVGDLAFADSQPLLTGGDLAGWTKLLTELERPEYRRFVPGHGGLAKPEDLKLQRGYIAALQAMVASVVDRKGELGDALGGTLPEPYDAWMATDMLRFEQNVRALFAAVIR